MPTETEQPIAGDGVWTTGPDGELIPDYESTFPTINEGEVDLPLVDRGEGGLVVGDQLAVRARGPDAVAGNRLLSLRRHTAADQYSQGPLAPLRPLARDLEPR